MHITPSTSFKLGLVDGFRDRVNGNYDDGYDNETHPEYQRGYRKGYGLDESEFVMWAKHGEPVRYFVRVQGEKFIGITREEEAEGNFTGQAQFELSIRGSTARWDWREGDLGAHEVPSHVWDEIWKRRLDRINKNA